MYKRLIVFVLAALLIGGAIRFDEPGVYVCRDASVSWVRYRFTVTILSRIPQWWVSSGQTNRDPYNLIVDRPLNGITVYQFLTADRKLHTAIGYPLTPRCLVGYPH